MELWQAMIVAFGGNAALLLVLAFLGRSFVGQLLTKDIEGFKASLHRESVIAVEELKADLQQTAVEHEVRFSRLHEKRGEVLAEVYKLLVVATWEAESFASPIEFAGEIGKKEKYVRSMNAIAEYYRYFDQHRVYLSCELCDALEAFAKDLRQPLIRFGVYVRIDNPIPKTIDDMNTAWDNAWNSVKNDVPKLRASIEDEFRKLLGVAAK